MEGFDRAKRCFHRIVLLWQRAAIGRDRLTRERHPLLDPTPENVAVGLVLKRERDERGAPAA